MDEKGMSFRFFIAGSYEDDSEYLWVCLPSPLKHQKRWFGYVAIEWGGTSFVPHDQPDGARLLQISETEARERYDDAVVDRLCWDVCERANRDTPFHRNSYIKKKIRYIESLKKLCNTIGEWYSKSQRARFSKIEKTRSLIHDLVDLIEHDDDDEILAVLKLCWSCYVPPPQGDVSRFDFSLRECIDQVFQTVYSSRGREAGRYRAAYAQITI